MRDADADAAFSMRGRRVILQPLLEFRPFLEPRLSFWETIWKLNRRQAVLVSPIQGNGIVAER